jgi:coenzyme F420-0:L-glutamate ligase/NADPH-dependent F420 reductase
LGSYSIIGGTGALGAALARRLALAGHTVVIGSRDADKAAAFAAEMKAGLPASAQVSGLGLADAAAAAEVCVLTVPYAAHADTLAQVRGGVQGKIVIDATVPLKPPKVGTVQLPAVGCAALETAAALGENVRVVSALQTIGAEKLASGGPIDADVLVAADDAEAAEAVRAMLAELGLRSWHVGPLANAAAAEAMTSLLIQINRRYKMEQAGVKITGRPKAAPKPGPRLTVRAVPALPLFGPGDDLAAAIADALAADEPPKDGDVIVVAQKVVSKVEDRAVLLSGVAPGAEAQDLAARTGKAAAVTELILAESGEIMRAKENLVIARHRTGHVAANAGIDASNVSAEDGEKALLWPVDPDASARALRLSLEARFGVKLAVVISDSLGRAWRMGTTGSAIASSGLKPLRDRRGESDLFGRVLQATVIGVADEIAAAASLVIGEAAEGLPVAVVSGAVYDRNETAGIGDILRPRHEDMFP